MAKAETKKTSAKKTAKAPKAKTTAKAATKTVAAPKPKACPKCGKPQQVIDVDHATKKVTYGCPTCDGDRLAQRDAQRKAEAEKAAAERAEAEKERQAQAATKAAETPPAEPKKERVKPQMSGLDAAAKVLAEAGQPMNCQDIVKAAFEKGYWASTGATPHSTIYAAMLREIQQKGDQARFKKTDRGMFALNATAKA